MQGLVSKTLDVFERVSNLNSIAGYHLVGGTGIALQVQHRLSEDLDFCRWVPISNAKYGIPVREIEQELKSVFKNVLTNHLSFDQVDFIIEGVKLTFFNEVGLTPLPFTPIYFTPTILGVSLHLHAAMKVKTLFERIKYRDLYDIFFLLKENHLVSFPKNWTV